MGNRAKPPEPTTAGSAIWPWLDQGPIQGLSLSLNPTQQQEARCTRRTQGVVLLLLLGLALGLGLGRGGRCEHRDASMLASPADSAMLFQASVADQRSGVQAADCAAAVA